MLPATTSGPCTSFPLRFTAKFALLTSLAPRAGTPLSVMRTRTRPCAVLGTLARLQRYGLGPTPVAMSVHDPPPSVEYSRVREATALPPATLSVHVTL